MAVIRIISGGQTGADRGGLDAAIALGIPHGGWCPKGRLAEDGTVPAKYVLRETDSPDYAIRTERNVKDSDGTVIFTRGDLAGGCALTAKIAISTGASLLHIDLKSTSQAKAVGKIRDWLAKRRVRVLNVAGSRESKATGIGADVQATIVELLSMQPMRKAGEWRSKWQSDVKAIYGDLVHLLFRRQMFGKLKEIVQANKRLQKPNSYIDWLVGNYAVAAAASVRRHTDVDPDSASLNRLILEIIEHPQALTKPEYMSQFEPKDVWAAEAEFPHWAASDGVNLDTTKLEADQQTLRSLCDPIRKYVTERIAHLDATPEHPIPTLDHLDRAIDGLETLVKKYYLFIMLIGAEVDPAIGPWEHVLMIPWIEPDEHSKEILEQFLGPSH
jgi:hypothetical protein